MTGRLLARTALDGHDARLLEVDHRPAVRAGQDTAGPIEREVARVAHPDEHRLVGRDVDHHRRRVDEHETR